MKTICHFSDWHGMWLDLPEADFYVCTGDMLPNSLGHRTDWIYEEKFQRKFIKDNPIRIPGDKPVYCVRGNHDHVPIGNLFPHSLVREFNTDKLVEDSPYSGFNFLGIRGVQRIRGNSPEEILPHELENRITSAHKRLKPQQKDLLVVTHCPPLNVMDDVSGYKATPSGHCGSARLYRLTQMHARVHFFGHIHEHKGIKKHNGVIYSNAATGINLIKLEDV